MGWGDVWNFAKDPAGAITGRGFGGFGDEVGLGDDPSVAQNEEILRANARLRKLRADQGGLSGQFAGMGERGFAALGQEGAAVRDQLRRQASGQDSISAEQLRQGLQQQQAMQQSLAAGARPANAAMAARTAMMQAGRNSSALAGQQALAGIAERQAANQALGQMIQAQRGQDLQAALGGRQNAINAYQSENTINSGETGKNKLLGAGVGVLGSIFSDERLKEKIRDGGEAADELVKGLRAHLYRYKDPRHGEGEQLGVMAQALEKTRIGKQVVRDTPEGKQLDGGKLAGALAAATARIGERLARLEEKAGK